jgi:putative ABC transport system substrate-binding protein
MKRREFIAGLGAAAWPLAARAQQPNVRRIGALLLGNADAETFKTKLRDSLQQLGYVEGRNINFEFRSADGNLDLLPKLAAELVALKVDVIVALFTPCAIAAKQATREIPIVIQVGDPVGTGLVASLGRPGGNITGMSYEAPELHGNCVILFRDMQPSMRRIAALGNAGDPSSKQIVEQVRSAGRTTGIEIDPVLMVRGLDEVDAAFATMKKERADAVVVQGSFSSKLVTDLALKHRLPSATATRSFVEVGGLMSYSPDESDMVRHSAQFVQKILNGSRPADLPVEQPTKFELVINLKTAKLLGLTISPSFLLRADAVIE